MRGHHAERIVAQLCFLAMVLLLAAVAAFGCGPDEVAWTSPEWGVSVLRHGDELYFSPEQLDLLTGQVVLGLGALPELSLAKMAHAASLSRVQVFWDDSHGLEGRNGDVLGLTLRVRRMPCWADSALRHELTHLLLTFGRGDADSGHTWAQAWAVPAQPAGACP